ncbi:pseudouridylate synthase [Theileria orientalis strain Shintoku]|uniref:Pseudouridylate synthase n=1 Tax=Theileria orientalis strain Shintoku TaxID=869250 RepID=J4CCL2_THEOR|nr:pseudouridylate synthase [Theileria orientalis strain Shintoku]BAM39587.1 pseudouridylate synthase [Theileria orientalis strain Shintoku]|eukprot:XP_009689888.1 pseudouridylate synthase [Theileria orientalis strain Shintoku]
MSSPDYKRRKKDARSKFRKLWKKRGEVLNGQNDKNGEGSASNQYNLNNSKDFPLLNGNTEVKKVHVPKIKYALAFGYIGTNYHGYQKQVEYKTGIMDKVKTVEGTVENCLIKIGAIDESLRNMNHKLQMSKSSRTDKGVHAACIYIGGRFNVNIEEKKLEVTETSSEKETECSEDIEDEELSENSTVVRKKLSSDLAKEEAEDEVKVEIKEPSKEELFIKTLNAVLPEDIRCFKIQRVTKGFDARIMCSKRKYEYLLPVWVLCRKFEFPNEEHEGIYKRLESYMEENMNNKENVKAYKSEEALYEEQGKYVEVEEYLEKLRQILKQYEGTKDFHNFTVKQRLETKNTQRYIEKIKVKEEEIEGMKLVRITIQGQSFLYNQIRKMICLALQEYLAVAPKNAVKYALKKSATLNINTVPSEGLILHHPCYDTYNATRCSMANIPYIEYKDIKPEVETFKRQYIYAEVKKSICCKIWEGWLETVKTYPFYLENKITPNGEDVK